MINDGVTTQNTTLRKATMRAYHVEIMARDGAGNKIEFKELVTYPDRPDDLSGCVTERAREAKAIEQVRARMPNLRNVSAHGSVHV